MDYTFHATVAGERAILTVDDSTASVKVGKTGPARFVPINSNTWMTLDENGDVLLQAGGSIARVYSRSAGTAAGVLHERFGIPLYYKGEIVPQ